MMTSLFHKVSTSVYETCLAIAHVKTVAEMVAKLTTPWQSSLLEEYYLVGGVAFLDFIVNFRCICTCMYWYIVLLERKCGYTLRVSTASFFSFFFIFYKNFIFFHFFSGKPQFCHFLSFFCWLVLADIKLMNTTSYSFSYFLGKLSTFLIFVITRLHTSLVLR